MTTSRRRTARTTRATRPASVAVFDGPASERETQPVKAVNWETEYGYVLRDIRQLFIISIIIFVLLIGVGFLL